MQNLMRKKQEKKKKKAQFSNVLIEDEKSTA